MTTKRKLVTKIEDKLLRANVIGRMHDSGISLVRIGIVMKLSSERVRQIYFWHKRIKGYKNVQK